MSSLSALTLTPRPTVAWLKTNSRPSINRNRRSTVNTGIGIGNILFDKQIYIDRGSMALTFEIFNYLLEYNLSIGISF